MNSSNHDASRALQRDAKAWATFTGTPYTAALRQMHHPLAQGILGERISARDAIRAFRTHPGINAAGTPWTVDEDGHTEDLPWKLDAERGFLNLTATVEVLRMFTPTDRLPADASTYDTGGVHLMDLTGTVNHCLQGLRLDPGVGEVFWAAVLLGLPVSHEEGGSGGGGLYVGISRDEHSAVEPIDVQDFEPSVPRAPERFPQLQEEFGRIRATLPELPIRRPDAAPHAALAAAASAAESKEAYFGLARDLADAVWSARAHLYREANDGTGDPEVYSPSRAHPDVEQGAEHLSGVLQEHLYVIDVDGGPEVANGQGPLAQGAAIAAQVAGVLVDRVEGVDAEKALGTLAEVAQRVHDAGYGAEDPDFLTWFGDDVPPTGESWD